MHFHLKKSSTGWAEFWKYTADAASGRGKHLIKNIERKIIINDDICLQFHFLFILCCNLSAMCLHDG